MVYAFHFIKGGKTLVPQRIELHAINLYSNSTILNFGENDGRDGLGWRRRSNIEAESRIKDQNRLQRV
jgi:hypothetical protein